MASLQHSFLKLSLQTASYAFQFSKPSVSGLRGILEALSVYHLLPWGTSFEPLDIDGMYAEWIIPADKRPDKVLFYLHGGAYAIGSPHTHRTFVGQITKKTGIRALVIDYRKAPEHQFPAALDDAIKAYNFLIAEGYLPQNIMLGGDSAGGGLCVSLLLWLRDNKKTLPKGAVLLSPWVDLEITGDSIMANLNNDRVLSSLELQDMGVKYAGKTPLNHPLISPLNAELSGLPPLLIQTSDTEVLYSDATRLAEKAEKAGVTVTLQVWEGLIHWWHLFWNILPEGSEAINEIEKFVRSEMKLKV